MILFTKEGKCLRERAGQNCGKSSDSERFNVGWGGGRAIGSGWLCASHAYLPCQLRDPRCTSAGSRLSRAHPCATLTRTRASCGRGWNPIWMSTQGDVGQRTESTYMDCKRRRRRPCKGAMPRTRHTHRSFCSTTSPFTDCVLFKGVNI